MKFDLIKGEYYQIKSLQEDYLDFPGKVRYVRREYLPSTGEEWETFFTRLPQDNSEGFLKRFRIPVSGIYKISDRKIFSNKEYIYKDIEFGDYDWLGKEKSSLVKSWLNEVKNIEDKIYNSTG